MIKNRLIEVLRRELAKLPTHPETDDHIATNAEFEVYDETLNIVLEGLRDTCIALVNESDAANHDIT